MKSIFYLLLMCLIFNTAQANIIEKDLISWEKDFIPALFHSGHGEKDKLTHDITQLQKHWKDFALKYSNSNTDDESWLTDFNSITKIINGLDKAQPKEVHLQLEKVRDMMIDLRSRNGIYYYMDSIYEFHDAMEAVIFFFKNNPLTNKNEWKKAELLIRTLIQKTETLAAAEINEDSYGFSENTMDKIYQYIDEISSLNSTLLKQSKAKNKQSSAQTAKKIKQTYIKLYLLFGRKETGKSND